MARSAVPTVAAYLAGAVGALNILRAVHPAFRRTHLAETLGVLPGVAGSLAGATSLVAGIVLVMLAHALRRRKRRAWRMVVVLLSVSAVVELLRWGHVLSGVVTIAVVVMLLSAREEFYALSDPRTRWRALWVLLGLGVTDVVVGWALVTSHSRAAIGTPDAGDRLQEVLLGLVGVDGPILFADPRTADLVYFSLLGLGALTAVTTIYLALRPERPAARMNGEQEREVRRLLTEHGARDSLGYFASRRDKSVIFSPSGKAAVSYRVTAGVMLASGDPIGDVEAWPGAIALFMDEARRHAWVPAVIGCSRTGGTVWCRQAGLSAWEIGDEAIVDVAGFGLEGHRMRNVRQMVHRVERAGYACEVRRVAELGPDERQAIRHAVAAWRGPGSERGFSMALGRLADPADPGCVVVTARQAGDPGTVPAPWGDLKAVLQFVPWGSRDLSLDVMCRDPAADPGLNELMIVELLRAAPGLGVTRVSLNFALFREALAGGERLGAGPVLRAWRALLIFLSRWFQIETLYRFNAKFRPGWEPRFVIFPTTRELPRIGFAALQAEGFIPSALLRGRFAKRVG
ncbi:DUF2156 domain-containing protein [Nonomuraea sp. MG754425]|uniref:phosphatidylglycerol lysyltransferase domain-containing protein n=1 Tax=Nonomuraea sp. MG754425 TaxID=2570319 RepID=UPI001F206419|nr:phosphatidylglycerol lysyltransferase domain-containing protein [Nonomuraea sp. MG754425]MCF6471955.1 DUF2156 domain-containing protein [Nonomuraea sp. MG754425]